MGIKPRPSTGSGTRFRMLRLGRSASSVTVFPLLPTPLPPASTVTWVHQPEGKSCLLKLTKRRLERYLSAPLGLELAHAIRP